MNLFVTILNPRALAAAVLLALAGHAVAQHAGYRTLLIPGEAPMTVALFYPTAVADRAMTMGPWQPVVAPGAPVVEGLLKGLILVSHGTGGTELNYHNLARGWPATATLWRPCATRATTGRTVR